MEKINNWNKIEAKGNEDYQGLPQGAYECIIKSAEEYTSMSTGNKSLKITLDINKGDYKDFFQKQYENMTGDKKWSNNATKYIGLAENSLPFFKGFITSVENSNSNYIFNFDESTLVGKKIAVTFEPEEYQKQDGSIGVAIKANRVRSLDKLSDIKVTKIKLLNGNLVDYSTYNKNDSEMTVLEKAESVFGKGNVEEEIPFEL